MEILQFIFASGWHFVGTCVLIILTFVAPAALIGEGMTNIARGLIERGSRKQLKGKDDE